MFTQKSCREFIDDLSSSAPVPGGGGASAMAGALGVALGSMVANLTLGKKKYEGVQEDIKDILKRAEVLREELLELVEEDARAFEPLSKAYGLPKNTEEERLRKEKIMEEALKIASTAPVKIMEKSIEAIELHERLVDIGNRIAISDVGVGVQLCKTSLIGASLNVFINTKLMKDRGAAEEINNKVKAMLKDGTEKADLVYNKVEEILWQ